MSTGTSLSGQVLFKLLLDFFKTIPDHRDPTRIEIALKDFLMAGFAIFELKFPSLLSFEEEMRKDREYSNLKSLFFIDRVPSDTHFRTVIDKIDSDLLRPAFTKLFAVAQRAKVLEDFKIFGSTYLLSIDGTGYFFSDSVHCENCLEKKYKETGETRYHHQMLCGSIVHPDKSTVIPLCPEAIEKQDGQTKNDCERVAMSRFLRKFREEHPKLQVTILTDALHSTLPNLENLKKFEMSYIMGVKPGSHEKLFEGMDKWEELNKVRIFTKEEEIGDKVKKKRIHEYRYTNGILLNYQSVHQTVNFLEYWETTQWVDKKGCLQETKKHFSWITDHSLYESTCEEIVRAGRTRWKIENETFNALKNQGYEFEHNFGHGYKNLSTNMAYFMMLAFLCDQLQEMKCGLFQAALASRFNRRSRFFTGFRVLYEYFPLPFDDWVMFLEMFTDPRKHVRRNTS